MLTLDAYRPCVKLPSQVQNLNRICSHQAPPQSELLRQPGLPATQDQVTAGSA